MSLCCISIRDEESQGQTWLLLYRCVQSSAFCGQGALVPPAPADLFCCTPVVFQCITALWPWGHETWQGQLMILWAPLTSLCSCTNISQGRGETAARAVSLSFPSLFNGRNFAGLVRNTLVQSSGEKNSPSPSFLMCVPPHENIVKRSDTEAYAGRAHPKGRCVI